LAASILLVSAFPACSPAGSIREEQVRFSNGDVNLAGSLFLPAGRGRHPAVVLFHGSGPHARDTSMARWFAGWGIAALTEDGLFALSDSAILDDPAMQSRSWFKSEMNYDPTAALRKLSVPALFIFGERDELVPVGRSVEIIRKTLAGSRAAGFTIKVFPGADHGIYVRRSRRKQSACSRLPGHRPGMAAEAGELNYFESSLQYSRRQRAVAPVGQPILAAAAFQAALGRLEPALIRRPGA